MKKKLLLAGATLLLVAAAVTGFAAYERSNMSDVDSRSIAFRGYGFPKTLRYYETVFYSLFFSSNRCNSRRM